MIKYSEWRETKYFRLERNAFDQLNTFFHDLYEARVRPVGENTYQKYALFHFIQRAEHLVETIGAILRRMKSDSLDHERTFRKNDLQARIAFAQGASHFIIEADDASDRYREFLVADFESLYQISGRLLDHWSLIITHVASMSKPRHINFATLYKDHISKSSATLCSELHEKHYEDIHWLHSHILVFRDKFIVHQNKPFQQSFRFGEDFRLSFILDPVWCGKEGKEKLHERIWQIHDSAPKAIQVDRSVIVNPEYVLGVLFERFTELEKEEQAKLIEVAKKNGFTSPSYLTIGTRVFEFIASTMETVRDFAKDNYSSINLGARQS